MKSQRMCLLGTCGALALLTCSPAAEAVPTASFSASPFVGFSILGPSAGLELELVSDSGAQSSTRVRGSGQAVADGPGLTVDATRFALSGSISVQAGPGPGVANATLFREAVFSVTNTGAAVVRTTLFGGFDIEGIADTIPDLGGTHDLSWTIGLLSDAFDPAQTSDSALVQCHAASDSSQCVNIFDFNNEEIERAFAPGDRLFLRAIIDFDLTARAIPEPGIWALTAVGMIGIAGVVGRRRLSGAL